MNAVGAEASEELRSQGRRRRANAASIASVVARATGFVTSLISVPFTLSYLGTERFGLWMALSSALVFLSFADLGLGNGLMTSIAHCHGRDDLPEARRQISSAFILLSGIAVVVSLVGVAISSLIDFAAIFSVRDPLAASEIRASMLILILGFAINLPLGVVTRAQTGLQGGFQSSLWQAGGNLLALVFVLLSVGFQAGLPVLIASFTAGPIVATTLNFFFFFGSQNPELKPQLKHADRRIGLKLLQLGTLFLILQVSASLATSSDNFILAAQLGSAEVTGLAVPARLFMILASITSVVTSPLWPAYGEAYARGDHAWVIRTLKRSVVAVLTISVFGAVVLVAFGDSILRLWVGTKVTPPLELMLLLGVWTVLASLGGALAVFLNGLHVVRIQVVCAVCYAILSMAGKWLAVPYWGPSGVMGAGVAAFVITTLFPYCFLIPRLLHRLSVQSNLVPKKA